MSLTYLNDAMTMIRKNRWPILAKSESVMSKLNSTKPGGSAMKSGVCSEKRTKGTVDVNKQVSERARMNVIRTETFLKRSLLVKPNQQSET